MGFPKGVLGTLFWALLIGAGWAFFMDIHFSIAWFELVLSATRRYKWLAPILAILVCLIINAFGALVTFPPGWEAALLNSTELGKVQDESKRSAYIAGVFFLCVVVGGGVAAFIWIDIKSNFYIIKDFMLTGIVMIASTLCLYCANVVLYIHKKQQQSMR